MLEITLLGQFGLRLNGAPVDLSARPAQSLLVFLLLNRTATHRRGRLAGVLWPDSPESSARKSLRNALWQLRRAIGEGYLLADKSSLSFNTDAPYRFDVATLEDEAGLNDLDALVHAVSVYKGHLLPGYYEDWVVLERERLQALFERRMQTLLDGLAAAGRWRDALRWAENWLALGHVPELAFRVLMMAHAALDNQAGMANSYRRCVRALEEELGVAPSPETQGLYERLAAGEEPLTRPHQPAVGVVPSVDGVLPTYGTPFVGRQEELAEIGRLLGQVPDCRLLTLVGPGGIGKTRLAVRAARHAAFAGGAWFVPLATLGSSASLVAAIAEALRLRLDDGAGARQQLLAHLHKRENLLILDNFEHLLGPGSRQERAPGREATSLLTELLEHAPRVKLLVTSRERLNLSAEWVFNVEGLRIPAQTRGEKDHNLATFSAVQLFLQRARQLKRDFGRDADELACAVRVCRLVGGMPLAIELAAAWANILSCREIRQEIERSLSFLQTNLRDYPERHQDMRAVFDTSWKMLADPERQLFRRLAVFRGGFTRAAAEAIGGEYAWTEDDLWMAPDGSLQLEQHQPPVLAALAGLVDKSFVRHTPGGRYEIHELMRQYGAAKLLARPEEERQARDGHARYYLAFLMHQQSGLTESLQHEVVALMAAEMENVNSAWRRAVAQGKLAAINQALSSYFNFCLARSRLHEGKQAFIHLVEHLQRADRLRAQPHYNVVLARALIRLAALYYFLGNYEEAWSCAQEGLSLKAGRKYGSDVAFAQIILGAVSAWRADRELAEKWLYRSLSTSREIDDKENMADALHELAQLHGSFGDYAKGKRLAQQSLEVSRDYGRPDWTANALEALAWNVVCLGEYAEAEACWREALAIYERLGSRHGTARALGGVGWIAWCRGAEYLDEAREYCEQSLSLAREVGYRLLVTNALGDLALIANEQGNYAQAETYSREGLRLAEEIGSSIYIPYHLSCLGGAASGRGDYAESRRYLRRALRAAAGVGLAPTLILILLHYATLLVDEGEAAGSSSRGVREKIGLALALLALIDQHPTTWEGVRERAARLRAGLEAELPEDMVEKPVAQGKARALDDVVTQLLELTR